MKTWKLKFGGFSFSCRHDCSGKVYIHLVEPSARDVAGGRASKEEFDAAKVQILAHWQRYGKPVLYQETVRGTGI